MKVSIVATGLAARYLAHLSTSVETLANIKIVNPTSPLDFYPMHSSKESAQWKRETRGRRLK